MKPTNKKKIEFGDFQTPDRLALEVCRRLRELGISPDVVIEPTCGVGSFVLAACSAFPMAKQIRGYEINGEYLHELRKKLNDAEGAENVALMQVDFFANDWRSALKETTGSILVLGNLPWVTNATQGAIGGSNLPVKTNFQRHSGFEAITGKANFDISEWMLIEILRWFDDRAGDVAMLVKSAVARKVISHAAQKSANVRHAFMIGVDAQKEFGAAVDASLLVMRITPNVAPPSHDYMVFNDLADKTGRKVGHRQGLTVANLDAYEKFSYLIGQSPQKWRSGVKHDASSIMELTKTAGGLENGFGEVVALESEYLFPLLKGSDVGSNKPWREKYTIVTQRFVGDSTSSIESNAPKTWDYLIRNSARLDARSSIIYKKSPRFAIFGIGDYAFRPWRIAICALYKALRFRLVGPIDGRPVMFDDTTYYLSFDDETEAKDTLMKLQSESARGLLSSLIFWDEKRPIKTGVLNMLDWTRVDSSETCAGSEVSAHLK
jgi:hypothetical protein